MKWLIACLTVLFMAAPAMSETPYIAIVGNDIYYNPFYLDAQYQQFTYDQAGSEQFRSSNPITQPEICAVQDVFLGEPNAVITALNSGGYFEWFVRLPLKPNGEISLCFQCGVLNCRGHGVTGERLGPGCVNLEVNPGENPILNAALPRIIAVAYPGPYSSLWTPFNLTAYRNPSEYGLGLAGAQLTNTQSLQVLDGSPGTRILLSSCVDNCIVGKLPLEGQVNALSQTEHDLNAGDLIYVRMDVPRQNTVDIYCHSQSLKVMGIGSEPNQPPVCTGAYATPSCLWPPNNQMVSISILGVTDPDGDPITLRIDKITSDEATASEKGAGGPNHSPDASGVGSGNATVRAERSGLKDGRIYVISFTASDGKGGTCAGQVAVKVPHDQSRKTCPAVDSGQKYDATKIN